MHFRSVEAIDRVGTRELVRAAFVDNEPTQTVAFLDALRDDDCILGEWVAEDASGLIAHVVFSRVWVECADGSRVSAAMLTPLAVRPDRQRAGVGLRLMHLALAVLEARGETLFFVLGHPSYYPRAGFRSEPARLVVNPWGEKPAFMVRGTVVPAGRLLLPKSIANAH